MPSAPPTRVNYFDRQFIRVAELQDEQAYHLALRRRHNLSHHSWGIVVGLEVRLDQEGRAVVHPGLAVDGYGRELLLVDRRVIDRADFDRYGTSRLDLWLEYQLEFADDRSAPVDCSGGDPRRRYRATERAQVVLTRGGALPDPRRPPGVPAERLEEPLLTTSDNPRDRWPVYLGRVTMDLPASGLPEFAVDATDRVYVGLNAEVIAHPGEAARIELGRRPQNPDAQTIGDDVYTYSPDMTRDFAIFVPPAEASAAGGAGTSGGRGGGAGSTASESGTPPALEPVVSVSDLATQVRGTMSVHGNVVLDGASLQFLDAVGDPPAADGEPAIYRSGEGDLRIDMGSLNGATRKLVIGATKDGEFVPALEVAFAEALASTQPVVRVLGNLRVEGTISSDDIRTRTVTEDVAALLTGMVQSGITSGGN